MPGRVSTSFDEWWSENRDKYTEKKLNIGDLVIAWFTPSNAIIGVLDNVNDIREEYLVSGIDWFCCAVKFESMEQYEKIRKGKL